MFSGVDGAILYTLNGDSAFVHFGYSVSGAGDVNNDGYADLIVGAPNDYKTASDSGSARVFSGWDGTILYTFNGDSAYDHLGYSVSGAGDVDGDGFADLIVGAYADDNNGNLSGSARVFSGEDGTILYTFNGDSAQDYFGWSVSGAGDVNNDGYADIIVGAYLDDNNGLQTGSARVISLVTPNSPPTAVAGPDQPIRAGDTVFLDGSESFDDNTASALLDYSWSFFSLPAGSTAALVDPNTATPSFLADVADTYLVELTVTDEGGLSSDPDEVMVSTDNLAPTALAGDGRLVIAGTTVFLDGSESMDPEMDTLWFAWTITSAPPSSMAALSDANTPMPIFVPDLEGVYEVTLVVSDFLGPGEPDTVAITAASEEDFACMNTVFADVIVEGLAPGQVTTTGNQNAFGNFLGQACAALQNGNLDKTIHKLQEAIERTDGCVLRGAPDGNGPGMDWIIDCSAQEEVYNLLSEALNALTP